MEENEQADKMQNGKAEIESVIKSQIEKKWGRGDKGIKAGTSLAFKEKMEI